ncbi:MAG: hypothetical protein JSS81_14930 [Acidobacteria bacterium]|nr:hypothetical protein [Acidobacteriota bacterium]
MNRRALIRFILLISAFTGIFGVAAAAAQTSVTTNRKIVRKKKPKQTKTVVPDGVWGAAGVNLTIAGRETGIEYDCAEARIVGKFVVSKNGVFKLKGTYTRRSPGPVRIDRQPAERPALFEGRVDRDRMTLRVTLTDDREELPEVVLKRGAAGRLRRCY